MKTKIIFLFMMILAVFMLPEIGTSQSLNEGFEGAFPPADWVMISSGTASNAIVQNSDQAHGGTKNARFSSYSFGSPYDEYMISPQLVTTATDRALSFWYRKSYNATEKFEVGWSSTGNSIADFTWGPEVSNASKTAWTQYTKADLPIGTKYVAIHYTSSYQYYLYIDDVAGPAIYVPSCPAPTNQTVTNLSATGAKLNWTSGGSTNFNVEYGPAGFTQGTGTLVAIATDNFKTLTGLSAATSYDWYVQDSCGVGDVSDWVGPNSFTTAINSFPFSEDFDGSWTGNPLAPSGWKVINNNNDTKMWSRANTYISPTHSGTYAAHGMGNSDDYIITPMLVLGANMEISWWDKVESSSKNNTYDVLLSTTNNDVGSFTVNLGTYNCTNTSWMRHVIDLAAYTGNVYIAFHQTYSASAFYGFGIDDVLVRAIPQNEIEVSEIISSHGGFGQGNYTVTAIVKNNGAIAQTNIPMKFLVDGGSVVSELMPTIAAFTTDTFTFTATVQSPATASTLNLSVFSALAGDEDTSNDTLFTTIANLSFPYNNDFESENNRLPQYWQSIVNTNGSGNISVYDNATHANSGTKSLALYTNTSTSGTLITSMPAVNSGLTSLRLEFKLKTAGPSELIVGVMTDPADEATFVGIDTFSNSTSYFDATVMFNTYAGAGKYISFRHSFAGSYDNFFIDDLKLFVPPTNDIKVTDIIGNYAGFGQGNYTVTAIVKNSGAVAQTNIPIKFQLNGGPIVSELIPSLAAFTTDTFTFTAKAQSSATTDTLLLSVYSALTNDEDNTNDTVNYFGVITMDFPYIEGFEDYNSNATPKYWTVNNSTGNSSAYAKVYSFNNHTGSRNFHLYNNTSIGNDKALIAALPIINSGLTSLRMEFWLKGEASDLIIGVMSNPNDTATFVAVDTLILPPSSYNKYAVMFNTYTGSGKYIAFKHGLNTTYDDFYIDDIKLYVPPTNEVQIAEIIRDYGGMGVTNHDTVTVIVSNNGTALQTALPISFKLDNGGVITENMPSLAAFSTDTFQFNATFDASAGGKHTLAVFTNLTTDEDNTNDTMFKNFITYGTHTLPFTEDFENDYTYFENDDANTNMFNLITAFKHAGNHSAYSQYSSNALNTLHETGILDLTSSTTPVFDFWHIALTEDNWDKCYIQISTDKGQTWTSLPDSLYLGHASSYKDAGSKNYFDIGSYGNWSNTPNNNMWRMERFNLAAYKNDTIRLRFFLDSDGSVQKNGWYIDDVTVQEEPPAVANLGNDTTLCAGSNITLESGMGVGYSYLWTVDGDTLANTTSSLTTDSSGIYTVKITGLVNTSYDTIVITDAALPTVASFTGSTDICYGDSTQLAMTFTGASPWNITATRNGITFNETGITSPHNTYDNPTDTSEYIITQITDANGCILVANSDTVVINVKPLPTVSINLLNDICESTSAFTLTVGSPANGTYSGTGVNSTTSTFDAATAGAGNHDIVYTVTDAVTGCHDSATTIQVVNALPNITATAASNPVPYNTNTTLNAAVSNAMGALSYLWTPIASINGDSAIQTPTTVSITAATQYVVRVTDAGSSCENTDTVDLVYSGGPISVSPISIPTSICYGDTVQVKAQSSGGNGNITYSWTSNPAGFTSTDENPFFNPTVDTWFIVEATDGANNAKDSVKVSILAAPTVSYSTDTTFICMGAMSKAILNFTGVAPFNYTYNGILVSGITATSDTISVNTLADVVYNVTSITDGNGCTSTGNLDSVQFIMNNLPTIILSDDDTMCFGDSVQIIANFTGAAPYSFTVNDGSTVFPQTSATNVYTKYIDPSISSNYVIESVTDNNGCNISGNLDSIYVFVNQLATATASDNDTMCFGDSVQITINFTGTAPYSFTVNTMTKASVSNTYNEWISPATTTTYNLISITDGNGCTANNITENVEVVVKALPSVPSFTGLAAAYCIDAAAVTLNPLPTGGTFTGVGIANGNEFTPATVTAGSYDIVYTVMGINGCTNSVTNSTVVNALPTVSLTGLASDYCLDAADVTVAGLPTGAGGVWSGTGVTTGTFSPSTAGVGTHTIYYTFTDANTCVNVDSATTIINALPVVSLTALSDQCVNSYGGLITGATPTGGTWTGTAVNNNSFSPAAAGVGTYYLTYSYTDANGCFDKDSIQQTVNPLPVINVTGLDAAYCANALADTLSATPTGGSWYGSGMSNGIFDPTAANLGSVNMQYFYTDANGCFSSMSISTIVHGLPSVSLGNDATICANDSIMLSAGTFASYLWSTGDTTATIYVDTTGAGIGTVAYGVIITDSNTCNATDTVNITSEAYPTHTAADTSSICGKGASIHIDAGYISGNSYTWSNGVNWSSVTVDTATFGGNTTAYLGLTITSSNNCVTKDSVFVEFREKPMPNLGKDSLVCWNHTITLDAGAGFTSYLWNNGATTQTITVDSFAFALGNNSYSVEVSNAVKCKNSDTMILIVDPCTGIPTPELTNAEIKVYPNPSKGQFQIDVTGIDNANYNLDIYNSVGAVVFSDKVNYQGEQTKSWKIDFSTYAKGVYYIRILSNGSIKVKRIIIQ